MNWRGIGFGLSIRLNSSRWANISPRTATGTTTPSSMTCVVLPGGKLVKSQYPTLHDFLRGPIHGPLSLLCVSSFSRQFHELPFIHDIQSPRMKVSPGPLRQKLLDAP